MTYQIQILESDLELMHERLLGLTFFERRLRECKKQGVSQVAVILPEETDPATLPKVNPKHTAEFKIEKSSNNENIGIPLYGILDLEDFPNVKFPVHTKEDFEKAEKFFIDDLVETSKTGWVGKNINKPISIFLSRRLAKTWVTPNTWSTLNLVIGLASGYFIAQASYFEIVLGGFLFQVCSIFDGVDGEIAKFRLEYSKFGAFLDSAVDNLSLLVFLIGCYVHVLRFSGFQAGHVHLSAGILLALIVILMGSMFFVAIKRFGSGSLTSLDQLLSSAPPSDKVIRFMDHAKQIIKKDFFSLVFFIVSLSGYVPGIFGLVALGTALSFPLVSYALLRYSK